MVQIGKKVYDLDGSLPKVDGVVLRSNKAISSEILSLLDSVGYHFDELHPMPALLRNYHLVPIKSLSSLLRSLVIQLEGFPKSIYELLLVSNHGFALNLPGSYPERVCKVIFSNDDHKVVRYLTLSQISSAVERFFYGFFS